VAAGGHIGGQRLDACRELLVVELVGQRVEHERCVLVIVTQISEHRTHHVASVWCRRRLGEHREPCRRVEPYRARGGDGAGAEPDGRPVPFADTAHTEHERCGAALGGVGEQHRRWVAERGAFDGVLVRERCAE
jgi:hypothetical protein